MSSALPPGTDNGLARPILVSRIQSYGMSSQRYPVNQLLPIDVVRLQGPSASVLEFLASIFVVRERMIRGAKFIGPASTEVHETTLRHSALNGSAFLRVGRCRIVPRRNDFGLSREARRTTCHHGCHSQPDRTGTGQGDGRERYAGSRSARIFRFADRSSEVGAGSGKYCVRL